MKAKTPTATTVKTIAYLPHRQNVELFDSFNFPGIQIMHPGVNEVPSEVWAAMQTHPFTKFKIEAGALVELDLTQEADRVHLARGTWEPPALQAMLNEETSEVVCEEIAAQMRRLKEARFPERWKPVGGEDKISYVGQCGSRIWKAAYSLPSQADLQHYHFVHPQNAAAFGGSRRTSL